MSDAASAPGLVKMGDRDDWRINFVRYGGPFIVECGLTDANPELGDTIAKVMVSYGADGRDRDFATTQKRAYVLAAAPDMLAALKVAVGHIEHMAAFFGGKGLGYSFEGLGEDMPGIRAAIAKATVPA